MLFYFLLFVLLAVFFRVVVVYILERWWQEKRNKKKHTFIFNSSIYLPAKTRNRKTNKQTNFDISKMPFRKEPFILILFIFRFCLCCVHRFAFPLLNLLLLLLFFFRQFDCLRSSSFYSNYSILIIKQHYTTRVFVVAAFYFELITTISCFFSLLR